MRLLLIMLLVSCTNAAKQQQIADAVKEAQRQEVLRMLEADLDLDEEVDEEEEDTAEP